MFTTTKVTPRLDALGEIRLFADCTRGELKRIAALSTETSARAGEVLCHEHGIGRQAFVIIEGEAEVSVGGTSVATLGPGDVFGEMALLNGGHRAACVTALTPMRLLVMSPGEFRAALVDIKTVARRVQSEAYRRRAARA